MKKKDKNKKYSFPTQQEMEGLKQFIRTEPNKNNKQLKSSARQWLKAHWENKLSYEINWLGMPIIQTPEDMIIMQEIIFSVRPDIIIETGVAHGGSLVYFSSLLELLGNGKVIGIDIDIKKHNKVLLEKHPMFKRIELIEGNSIDQEVKNKVMDKIAKDSKVMVILDSNHKREHVSQELRLYSPLVSIGSYIIVEDTIMPLVAKYKHSLDYYKNDNSAQAVKLFLKENKHFISDKKCEKLFYTYFPNGYLKRIS